VSPTCNQVKALANINQGCQISNSLAQLAAALPVSSTTLNEASGNVANALNMGQAALQSTRTAIVAAGQATANIQSTVKALAALPETTANAVIRDATQQINNIAMGAVGVMNALNCVVNTLTGSSIPGMSKATSCIASAISALNKASASVQSTINGWQKTVNNSITSFMNNNLTPNLSQASQDSSAVACLSSMLAISDTDFANTNSAISANQSSLGALGTGAGSCAGNMRGVATTLAQATAGLSQAASLKAAQDAALQLQVNRILTAMPQDPTQAAAVQAALVNVVNPQAVPNAPLTPVTDSMPNVTSNIGDASAATSLAAEAMDTAANQTDLVSVSFTFGHEVLMDRVGNFIRIRHKDGHYTLYNATNIIHAADVQYKHLLWLENAITKFNSHTHKYFPGSGALTPTLTPTPIFDLTDGTTVTMAG